MEKAKIVKGLEIAIGACIVLSFVLWLAGYITI